MKLLKEKIYLLLALFLMGLTGCGYMADMPENKSSDITYITLVANAYGGNIGTELNGTIYFRDNDNLMIVNAETTDTSSATIYCTDVDNYYVCGDAVYFTKKSETGIFEKDSNGSVKQIYAGSCDTLIVYQNVIYFNDFEGTIRALHIDTCNAEELWSGAKSSNLFPTEDSIYFSIENADELGDSTNLIKKYCFSTGEVLPVDNIENVDRFYVIDNVLFFLQDGNIFSHVIDAGRTSKITQNGIVTKDSFTVYRGNIIYSETGNGGNTFMYSVSMNRPRIIDSKAFQYIFVIGDSLYTDGGYISMKNR